MKKMSMREYQKWTRSVWSNKDKKFTLKDDFVMTVGLAGETGEVLEVLKKRIRDNKIDLEDLKKELGDVFYYWNMICNRFGFDAEDVMMTNVRKLEERYKVKNKKA